MNQKKKTEPPMMRFKKLNEKLSGYDFQLGYKKGKDLVLADFLSRNPHIANEDSNEAKPIVLSLRDRSVEHDEGESINW